MSSSSTTAVIVMGACAIMAAGAVGFVLLSKPTQVPVALTPPPATPLAKPETKTEMVTTAVRDLFSLIRESRGKGASSSIPGIAGPVRGVARDPSIGDMFDGIGRLFTGGAR